MKVRRCLLKSYPDAALSPSNFEFDDKIELDPSSMQHGQVLIKLLHISVDPYMRTRFKPGMGYLMNGYEIGKPIDSGCIAEIVESKNSDFPVGAIVKGHLPWETFQIIKDPAERLEKLPPPGKGVPASHYYLGPMGTTGLSAYLPFKHFAKEYLTNKDKQGGSVVFVSGAAGAVGSIFGQICKTQVANCKVYGSAGSQDKIGLCKDELGFDDAFNYKDGIAKGLDEILGDQTIDVYFDNVGGEMLDEVLNRMSNGGKIICCGAISDYDKSDEEKYRLKNYFQIVTKCLTLHGFLLGMWRNEMPEARQEVGKLLSEQKLVHKETVLHGFDKVTEGLIGLFSGKNSGKMIITV